MRQKTLHILDKNTLLSAILLFALSFFVTLQIGEFSHNQTSSHDEHECELCLVASRDHKNKKAAKNFQWDAGNDPITEPFSTQTASDNSDTDNLTSFFLLALNDQAVVDTGHIKHFASLRDRRPVKSLARNSSAPRAPPLS